LDQVGLELSQFGQQGLDFRQRELAAADERPDDLLVGPRRFHVGRQVLQH